MGPKAERTLLVATASVIVVNDSDGIGVVIFGRFVMR